MPKPNKIVERYLSAVGTPCGDAPMRTKTKIVWASECGHYRAKEAKDGVVLQIKVGASWYDDESLPDLKSLLREVRTARKEPV